MKQLPSGFAREHSHQDERTRRVAPLSSGEFAEFYAASLARVRGFLRRRRCDPHLLDDLTQETFLRAWTGRASFSGNVPFQTWVLGIAQNLLREGWRGKVVSRLSDREPLTGPPTRTVEERESAQAVRAAIKQLPPKQRTAITLVYLDGLARAAASNTHCAHDAFRRRLAYGRVRLRRLLRHMQSSETI